jgi:hypothetical protein
MDTSQMNTLMRDLDLARDMRGQPLSDRVRSRIALAVEHPGEASWDDVHGFLLNPRRTLWEAVLVVDPGFAAVRGPVWETVNPADDCAHPDPARDFGTQGARWHEVCESCGASRPVHFPWTCADCDGGPAHPWEADPERGDLRQVSGWSRTPTAATLRQAIAWATH